MAPAGSRAAASSIARSFASASAANIKAIVADLENNIELQTVVQNTIADFKRASEQASQSNTTVSDMVQSITKRRRSRHDTDDADETAAEQSKRARTEPESTTLRRGQLVFADWTLKLKKELFLFVDLELDVQAVAAFCKNPDSAKEAMELAFDLRCYGAEQDRVGSAHKPTLFRSLAAVYERLGCRLRDIEVDMATGRITWTAKAVISIGPLIGDGLLVTWRKGDQSTSKMLTTEMLAGDKGPFEVVRPYSVASALVRSEVSEFPMASLFPQIHRRSLARRVSDELGASVKMTAEECKQRGSEKKLAKRKAPAVGFRSLSSMAPADSAGSGGGGASAASVPPSGAPGNDGQGPAATAKPKPKAVAATPAAQAAHDDEDFDAPSPPEDAE